MKPNELACVKYDTLLTLFTWKSTLTKFDQSLSALVVYSVKYLA
jgi:hypothetical protein